MISISAHDVTIAHDFNEIHIRNRKTIGDNFLLIFIFFYFITVETFY